MDAEYPFAHTLTVRLRDLDVRGHVNNAVLSTFIEDARLAWYRAHGDDGEVDPMDNRVDMVLARTEIDFCSEVREVGAAVSVGIRVGRTGTKSVTLQYLLTCIDGRIVARAESVLVGFDFDRGVSVPIPEAWRRRLVRAGGSMSASK